MSTASRTVSLRNRETGEVSTTFDVTGWSWTNFGLMWDGLVRKVNFEHWEAVYDPELGDEQSIKDWLAGGAA